MYIYIYEYIYLHLYIYLYINTLHIDECLCCHIYIYTLFYIPTICVWCIVWHLIDIFEPYTPTSAGDGNDSGSRIHDGIYVYI